MATQLTIGAVTQRLSGQFGSSWHADGALGAGAAGDAVTGIAVAWTPTFDVLRRAMAKKQAVTPRLADWQPRPDRGEPVSLADFDPARDSVASGDLAPLDRWVLDAFARTLASW